MIWGDFMKEKKILENQKKKEKVYRLLIINFQQTADGIIEENLVKILVATVPENLLTITKYIGVKSLDAK